jgi:hypothetical protein
LREAIRRDSARVSDTATPAEPQTGGAAAGDDPASPGAADPLPLGLPEAMPAPAAGADSPSGGPACAEEDDRPPGCCWPDGDVPSGKGHTSKCCSSGQAPNKPSFGLIELPFVSWYCGKGGMLDDIGSAVTDDPTISDDKEDSFLEILTPDAIVPSDEATTTTTAAPGAESTTGGPTATTAGPATTAVGLLAAMLPALSETSKQLLSATAAAQPAPAPVGPSATPMEKEMEKTRAANAMELVESGGVAEDAADGNEHDDDIRICESAARGSASVHPRARNDRLA